MLAAEEKNFRYSTLALFILAVALQTGCETSLDPQQYVARSEIRAVQQPATEPVEEEEDDIPPPTTSTRRLVDASTSDTATPDKGTLDDETSDERPATPNKAKSDRPEDVAKWKQTDYLAARRALDDKLYEAIAYLFEKRAQDEEAAKILTSLIEYKPDDKEDAPVEVVLLEDALPPPGQIAATREAFTWVKKPTYPVYSGQKSFHRATKGFDRNNPYHTCRFEKIQEPVAIGPRDTIFAYVYLDPDDPPEALMLGYKTNRWHGAFWGAEGKIDFGSIRKSLGELPVTGKWVRLAIPAKAVEVDGFAIQGMAFLQFGGTVYWDKAGVEKHQGTEIVAPIIAALGRNKTAAARDSLAKLLKGELCTQLPEPEAARRAWKAISANLGKGGEMDKGLGELLLTMVSQPESFRPKDAEEFKSDDLFKQSLSKFKQLATAETRMELAKKLPDANATPDQLRELTDLLAKSNADNFPAQLKLYAANSLDHRAALKFSDNFAKLSSAALADTLSIKRGEKPDSGEAIEAAQAMWTPEFSQAVLKRFIETEDASIEPDAALLAMTMPLAANREALRVFYDKAGRTTGPRRLEEAGVFGEKLIDPGMIPVLKSIWHNNPAARRKSNKGERNEELSLPDQWSTAVGKLVVSMNEQFRENGEEGMYEGKSPIALHTGATVTRSFSRDWLSADDDDLGDLTGHGVGTTFIRYTRTEDELNERLAKGIERFYSAKVSRSITHKIDEETTWIEGLLRGKGGRLRSVDIVLHVERPLQLDGGLEPAEGGLGPGGNDALDRAVGAPEGGRAVPQPANAVQAQQMQQLQFEYQRYSAKLNVSMEARAEALARAQRAGDRNEQQRRLAQAREEEENISRYRGKLLELEQQIRAMQQGAAPQPAPERKPEPRREPSGDAKIPVTIDILVIEIDAPEKG